MWELIEPSYVAYIGFHLPEENSQIVPEYKLQLTIKKNHNSNCETFDFDGFMMSGFNHEESSTMIQFPRNDCIIPYP